MSSSHLFLASHSSPSDNRVIALLDHIDYAIPAILSQKAVYDAAVEALTKSCLAQASLEAEVTAIRAHIDTKFARLDTRIKSWKRRHGEWIDAAAAFRLEEVHSTKRGMESQKTSAQVLIKLIEEKFGFGEEQVLMRKLREGLAAVEARVEEAEDEMEMRKKKVQTEAEALLEKLERSGKRARVALDGDKEDEEDKEDREDKEENVYGRGKNKRRCGSHESSSVDKE